MFFIKKWLQHNYFPVKDLKTPCSTERLWWLLFKISSSNKSVQRCFSDISYAKPISDNQQLPQWQTNLKMHSLTKNLFWYKNYDMKTKYEKLRYLVKSSRIYFFLAHISISFFFFLIRTFLALSNDHSFSCLTFHAPITNEKKKFT